MDIRICRFCDWNFNASALSVAEAEYAAAQHAATCAKRPLSLAANIDSLDKLLELMNMRGVSHVNFDSQGAIVGIQMKHDFKSGTSALKPHASAPVTFTAAAMQEMQEQHKESDIELALNPPSDVKYPVDDGKD